MASHFPDWIRRNWASGENVQYTRDLVQGLGLHTVCQSARCPNMHECWSRRTATLMVLGNVCSRSCRYCSVPGGHPDGEVDRDEPERVAEAVRSMGLRHVVITSVTRDDLADGGAEHIAATIRAVRAANPETTIEVLTPDFQGRAESIGSVMEAGPEVFSHNIETVRRLHPALRGQRVPYDTALDVLVQAGRHEPRSIIKSAFMVGHGETADEVRETLEDLYGAGCEAVNIGQYLRPTTKQREVVEFIPPRRFAEYEQWAYELGFRFAVAGPFVRSSYRSDEMMEQPFARERVRALRRTSL